MASEYVSFPVMRPGAWQQSALTGAMIPVFDRVTLLREDYDRIMAGGGGLACSSTCSPNGIADSR